MAIKQNPRKLIIDEAQELALSVFKNKALKKIFALDEYYLFELIGYRLNYYLWRVLEVLHNQSNLDRAKTGRNFSVEMLISSTNAFYHDYLKFTKTLKNNSTIIFSKSLKQDGFKVNSALLKIVGKLNVSFYKVSKVKLLFILPGIHSVKLIKLFNLLNEENIPYLLITHSISKADVVFLVKNHVRFIDRINLDGYVNKAEVDKLILKQTKEWRKIKRQVSFLNVKGSRSKTLNLAIITRVDAFVANELRELISNIQIAKQIVHSFSPSVIVSTTDPDFKVAPFIKVAKNSGVKSLTIQHGAYAHSQSVNFLSDICLVWGNYYSKWFVTNLAKKQSQLKVTGSVFFDDTEMSPALINTNLKSVLILLENTALNNNEFELMLIKLISLLKTNRFKKIFIRNHPWQVLHNKKLIDDELITFANNMKLDYYLRRASLVISMATTAGFNALIAGKQVIYWDFDKDGSMPYDAAGVPIVRTMKDFEVAINKYKNGTFDSNWKMRESLMKDVFYKLDNRAYLRVYNEILKFIPGT